jgi:Domain of unknown function (DUF6268)
VELTAPSLRGAAVATLLGLSPALWPRVATAQLPALAEVTTQYLPGSRVPDSGGLQAQVTSYDAALNLPLALGESTFLVAGALYHVDSISYAQAPLGFTELNALHAIDFPILLVQLLSPQWSLSMRVWPGAASDAGELDRDALRVGALAMLSWSPHSRLTLGGGPLASYAFGQLLPLPLIYVDWKPKPWFRIEASVPAFASALFTPGDRWELGVEADVNGNEYAIREPEIRDQYPCRARAADDPQTLHDETRADARSCLDHLAYSVVAAGVVARFRIVSCASRRSGLPPSAARSSRGPASLT